MTRNATTGQESSDEHIATLHTRIDAGDARDAIIETLRGAEPETKAIFERVKLELSQEGHDAMARALDGAITCAERGKL